MSFEDRTDHNRIAEQMAARLRDEAAGEATANQAATAPKPRRPVRLETVPPAEIVTPTPPVEPAIVIPTSGELPPLEILRFEQGTSEWHRARMGIPTASCFDAILTPSRAKVSEAMPDGSFPIKTEDDLKAALVGYGDGKKKTRLKKHIITRARAIDALTLLPEEWEVPEAAGTVAEQKTRQTYLYKLAGEILTGYPMDTATTYDMQRGHLLEPEARDLYRLQTGAALDCVGFLRRGRVGCSPDSLIGADGGLEIKTKLPHLLIDLTIRDEFPDEHKAQVQGAMWLTGRPWWDLEVVGVVEIDDRPALAPNIPPFIKRAYRDEAFIANLAAEVERFNQDLDAIVEKIRSGISISEFAAAA